MGQKKIDRPKTSSIEARNERLSDEDHAAFAGLVRDGLKQYNLTAGDLADQTRIQEESRQQKPDLLHGLKREQVKIRVQNALARPCMEETARCIVWRLANAEKAVKWRYEAGGMDHDSWFQRFWNLNRARAPYVYTHHRIINSEADYLERAFIHPGDVEIFVERCLDDANIKPKERETLKNALIKSIRARSWDRAWALKAWAAQSESFVDVRVYEGPHWDPECGRSTSIVETRIKRVNLWENEREPLRDGEREPRFYERLGGVMSDILTHDKATVEESEHLKKYGSFENGVGYA